MRRLSNYVNCILNPKKLLNTVIAEKVQQASPAHMIDRMNVTRAVLKTGVNHCNLMQGWSGWSCLADSWLGNPCTIVQYTTISRSIHVQLSEPRCSRIEQTCLDRWVGSYPCWGWSSSKTEVILVTHFFNIHNIGNGNGIQLWNLWKLQLVTLGLNPWNEHILDMEHDKRRHPYHWDRNWKRSTLWHNLHTYLFDNFTSSINYYSYLRL